MAAYLLVTINMREDQTWREAYRQTVPSLIRSFGGEYAVRFNGGEIAVLEGDACIPDGLVLIRFPSMECARGFVESDAYQPFREARMAASTANILAFESDD
jgi:uncharacterized protein (DUF1330 family)